MNALVKIGMNAAGLLSPTSTKLLDAALDVTSLARAKLLGQTDKAAALKAATATSTQSPAELTEDMFLSLLVQQMQNQDPLEPMSNENMLAQLAQFSALEQMNNLNEGFEALSGSIDQLNFITASAMVGRTVTGVDTDGELVQGLVESVHLQGSLVYLTVDGRLMSMAGVQAVE